MSEAERLASQMNLCADIARTSPDDFTYLNGPAREMLKKAAAVLRVGETWRPIDTAPLDQIAGVDPLIMIACIRDGRILWAVAARWTVEMYGYIHCASRAGWQTDYMPPIALAHNKPKHPGEWLMPDKEVAPTHWRPLPPADPEQT